MIHFKFTKIAAIILAISLFAEPLFAIYGFTRYLQAEETFPNIYALYDYWCSNDYENFPDNVGNVYCYYYPSRNSSSSAYNPEEAATTENIAVKSSIESNLMLTSSAALQDFNVGEPIIEPIEVSADENCVLVIGLIHDTLEAEQEILSKLQNKDKVAFTSCKYSYKELWRVQTEITQMMMEEAQAEEKQLGIIGSGITCSVERDHSGAFMPMKNYVDVTVLEEFYEKTAAMLIERYADKVAVVSSGNLPIEDVEETAITIGMDSSKEKKTYQLLNTTTALTLGDKFQFKGNWKKTNKINWTVNPEKKVKKLSENVCNFKIQAKKTGYITIQARNQKGDKIISEKVFIFDKKGTVSNQKQLLAALNSENIKKITIKTAKEKKFTIPEGNYGEKNIVVDAPKSDIYINDLKISEYLSVQKVKNIFKKDFDNLSNKNSIEEISSVLEKNGYIVQCELVGKQFLTGDRYRLILNNDLDQQIVLYQYEDSDKAKTESEYIDKNGYSVKIEDKDGMTTVTDIEWVSSPHFYLFSDLIVQYVGTEAKIITTLQNLCGNPFAGDTVFSFLGTILELNSTKEIALIEPEEGSNILSSGDRVSVNLTINPEEKFLVGDKVRVFYDGSVMETYPLQINTQGVEKV